MSGSIALVIALVLLVAYGVLVRNRQQRSRDPWHLLRHMSPVSGQWLADLRRSG